MKAKQVNFPFVANELIKNKNKHRLHGGHGWECASCGKKITDENGEIITNIDELPEYHPDYVFPRREITYTDKKISANDINALENVLRKCSLKIFNYIYDNEYNEEEQYRLYDLRRKIVEVFGEINDLFQEYAQKYQIVLSHYNIFENVYNYYKKEVKQIINDVIEQCKQNIQDIANKINKQERFENNYLEELPLCLECRNKTPINCEESGCDFQSLDIEDFILLEDKSGKDLPYCEEHAQECKGCQKNFHIQDMEFATNSNEWYCKECFWDVFTVCHQCNTVIYREDALYDEDDEEEYCQNCYEASNRREKGIDSELTKEEENIAEDFVNNINQNQYFPLDENTLLKSVIPTFKLAANKSFKSINDLLNFLEKRIQSKDAKAAILAILNEQTDPKSAIDFALSNFEKQIQEYQSQKEIYGKPLRMYPVKFKLEAGKMHGGHVFAIYPTNQFLNYADALVPGAKAFYLSTLNHKGHHKGALAYARFSISNDVIVVDNLQTDLDSQSLGERPEEKYWATTIKKFWLPTLLDALRRFGNQIGKSIYLTSFEMQQIKWRKIPERNKDVYDRIPEAMGFRPETIEVKPESLKKDEYEMLKIAKLSKFYLNNVLKHCK